ncbi:hypothetical protein CBL_10695 [Carabus blaptoides fortunei]
MFGDLTVAEQARLLAVVKSSGDEDFRGYANGVERRVSRGLVRRINTQRGCAHGQAGETWWGVEREWWEVYYHRRSLKDHPVVWMRSDARCEKPNSPEHRVDAGHTAGKHESH